MNRLRFDRAFFRVLFIAVPLSCGGKTFYEASPSSRCGGSRVIAYDWMQRAADGGIADGGTGGVADAGVSGLTNFSDIWCAHVCGDTLNCEPAFADGGQAGVRCISDCNDNYASGCGRRLDGLLPPPGRTGDVRTRYLEQAAYLEAASVQAFRRLAAELRAHGAPARLVRDAEAAAEEEIRHAHRMNDLVARRGGTHQQVEASVWSVRSLEQMALENAIEGCVRETYGAWVAWWQATTAQDPALREAMGPIAREETGHARLSFAIDRWAQKRLSATERQAIQRAKRAAVQALGAELTSPPSSALEQWAGWPSAEQACAWHQAAQQELWL
ncbi:MAG: hypothetical protein JNJ46_00770 [Myxococcales bacterium]|nr:hypothetical protein [Myxococcales bacterium]